MCADADSNRPTQLVDLAAHNVEKSGGLRVYSGGLGLQRCGERGRRRRPRGFIVAFALVLSVTLGCVKNRTEIVLGMATDLTATTPLSSVRLQVYSLPEDVLIADQALPISGTVNELYELPGTYAVYSAGGSADRFRALLTATDNNGKTLVVRSAVLSLVPEKTLFARLGMVSACEGMTDCGTGQTCVEGHCASEDIDSSRLPEYTPGMENQVDCASATTFVNTSTKQPLKVTGTSCGIGTCLEGVCLGPPAPNCGGDGSGDGSADGDGNADGNADGSGDAAVSPCNGVVNATVVNGNFEMGASGFCTGYTLVLAPNQITTNGACTVAADVSKVRAVYTDWGGFGDHTSGTGNMLICDGALTAGAAVWTETVSAIAGKSYLFSFWATNATTNASVPTFQAYVNSMPVGTMLSPTSTPGAWVEYQGVWPSCTTTARLSIVDISTSAGGNDFVVDDVSFTAM